MFERLRREAPPMMDVAFLLSNDEPPPCEAGMSSQELVHVTLSDLFRLGYPEKCRAADWEMAGNLDLVFLEFARRRPYYDRYWFVEYDVHWEGNWSVFFERFRRTGADLLATTILPIDEVPHKRAVLSYPRLVMPAALNWTSANLLKGFLPICRLSRRALQALHDAYQAGLGGHYEITVPSIAAQTGMRVEDIGGNGPYVRPENRNRFYFAQAGTYSHSPGTFVFRPAQKVLPYQNTLWHPVKPAGVSLWHPLLLTGSPLKTLIERAKPLVSHCITRLWFATVWRPLRDQDTGQKRPARSRKAFKAGTKRGLSRLRWAGPRAASRKRRRGTRP
ncbi:hypothetical protein [Roseomonas sp. BN140053]|uniref:hypothetical protein n=1 Tax=Roseomonas sp. BN140053 TaxID=3391898 RepID=UPI0039E8A051